MLLMKRSKKLAICASFAALSVVLMLLTGIIPVLTYAIPALAGLILTIIVIEINKRWALAVYFAVSIISAIIIPDKEAVAMYIAFFGYYPIIKSVLESKLPIVAEYIAKFVLFNASMVGVYCLLMFVLLPELKDELLDAGKWFLPVLLAGGNIFFFLYDYAMTKLITAYNMVWHKLLHRIFK